MQNKYCIHIPLNTCGRGLKLMHLGPVLINPGAKIGEDCSIHINVSVVAGGTSNQAPVLSNGCVIGVGATVCGAVFIASNVAIGANSVVIRDVNEPNITVAGNPARKISNGGSASWNKSS